MPESIEVSCSPLLTLTQAFHLKFGFSIYFSMWANSYSNVITLDIIEQ